MYLSNSEKEALWLTGYGDVPPWAVVQGLEQALARGSYVPGEEALRLRLGDALDLEERLATQRADEALNDQSADPEPQGDAGGAAAQEATSGSQEEPGGPSGEEWRSPLEIVQEGALEHELERPDEEAAGPAAAEQEIEDRDFSSFTKTQLVNFAKDQFGVDIDRRESRDQLIAQVQGLVDQGHE